MLFRVLAVIAALPLAAPLQAQAALPPQPAQTTRDAIALGDRAYADRRLDAAITAYVTALRAEPKNYEALWKASRTEVDLGESLPRGAEQDSAFAVGERHAADAVAVGPRDAQGHYALARAVGRKALSVGAMERIRYGKVVRREAIEALRYDSLHPGALHVLGMWHAEVMRVNGVARAFARSFLGADVFALASWAEATRLLERAVALDGNRIVHRLDLGAIYMDQGNRARAREQFEWIARAPDRDVNDAVFKRRAADRLRRL